MVYGVCLKYLKDRESARDSVMQLYELLVKDLLVHEVRNFRGWLYVKTRNHCLMELRSLKKMPHEEIGPLLMENGLAEHPEEEVMLYRDTDKLDKCLQSLAEPQQRCIALFYLEEKCYKEISAATGYDYNQVKSHIQNGKRNLKNCIEQHGS
jgi:RNA polymerase sigma-70 factor (ECF subfamily)